LLFSCINSNYLHYDKNLLFLKQTDVTCDKIVDSVQCTTDMSDFDCFWLYDSASGTSGACQTKTNSSLKCGDAKRPDQCLLNDVMNFESNCVWLEGNSSRNPEVVSKCMNKVCLWYFNNFCYWISKLFSLFFFVLFISFSYYYYYFFFFFYFF
jgi:hypothetical protein